MRLLKRLALVLCLALLPLDYSNAQDVQTSAWLTDNTFGSWAGCYTNGGTYGVWGEYAGGPCPNMSTGGSGAFRFSYGQYTVSQAYDLEYALQAAGTGLQINGYNYHWHVKNSNINGNQPGSYDPIAYIDVTLFNRDGSVAIRDRYDYGYYLGDWTVFGGTRTFDNPYSLTQVKDLQVSITGKDSGFWAGWYGPEFDHVLISVNYSVNPCASDPMYSPTCPGYYEALAKLLPANTPEVEVITQVAAVEPSVVETAATSPVVSQTTSSQPSTTTEMAAALVVEQKTQQTEEKKPGASLSTILSIVGKEQSRISSLEQSVVSESVSQAFKDADKTVAEAEAVAQQSSNQSQEINAAIESQQQASTAQTAQATTIASISVQILDGKNSSIASSQHSVKEETNFTMQNDQVQTGPTIVQNQEVINTSMGAIELKLPDLPKQEENVAMGIQVFANDIKLFLPQLSQSSQQEQTSSSFTLIEPPKVEIPVFDPVVPMSYNLITERRVQEEIELPKFEEYKVGTTTPANDFLEPKITLPEQNPSQTTETVKKSTQTNELAVGTKIESLAITPFGFDQYNIALKDVPFYQPKEIYKGQKNVDNARALRQLSTDKLHREMIEQQYRR